MEIPELPNCAEWVPRTSATETLQSAFLSRCLAVERLIKLRADSERGMNIDNYDSGIGLEDVVREELRKILPTRYSIDSGIAVDRDGRTSGDHDVIVFSDFWFPQVKAGATPASRRAFFPIEGAFAVGEIKQTLDYDTFDEAMRKLVVAHRLTRPPTFAMRTVENRESCACSHGLSNPLYSFILAINLSDNLSFEKVIDRFYDINRQVKRHEVVRALCVLGHGAVVWGYRDPHLGGLTPALFMMEDLYLPLVPMYFRADDIQSSIFALLSNLMLHLFHTVLAAEDIPALYGTSSRAVKGPKSDDIVLPPDPGRLESLKIPCSAHHSH
ncbi:MAG: hypothetical protein L0211_03850 [Planctomycetaceae bacterium]|nr:hypothetical protein [Planctomycetaceae bacterium]